MNYAKIPYKSTTHQPRGSSTRSLLYCSCWTGTKWKERKEVVRRVYTLVQKEDKHFLHKGGCAICFDNNASEAEWITDTKKSRKVNHQIHWRPEQNAKYWINLSATQKLILADKVQAIIMYQSPRWKNAL